MPDHYKFWLDNMLGKIPVLLILATSARADNGQAMLSLVPFLIIAKSHMTGLIPTIYKQEHTLVAICHSTDG